MKYGLITEGFIDVAVCDCDRGVDWSIEQEIT